MGSKEITLAGWSLSSTIRFMILRLRFRPKIRPLEILLLARKAKLSDKKKLRSNASMKSLNSQEMRG